MWTWDIKNILNNNNIEFSWKELDSKVFYDIAKEINEGKIVGVFGEEPPAMITTVSVDIDLAREIYQRLISQGWRKTEAVWPKKEI